MEDGDRSYMILIIKICKISFHYFEFIKPIEDVLKKIKVDFITIHYKDLTSELLIKADKVIICGTSLKDNSFLEDIEKFRWFKKFEKPILGICGGMHLLGLIYEGQLIKSQEIGLKNINLKNRFFEFEGRMEVYELHNFCVKSKEFDVIAESEKCPQIIKHKYKPLYGVLFHPEVRNKKLIEKFVKTKSFNI